MHQHHRLIAHGFCLVGALILGSSIAAAQGDVARVNVDSVGAQANAGSNLPSLSHDGRYVAFASTATNLTAGGTSGARHVYVRDRQTSTTTLVTQHLGIQANGDSDAPVLSADGRYLAFHTLASNLGPLDGNGSTDVYLLDRQTNTFVVASNGLGGPSGGSCCPGISADGRWVAFYSGAADLVLNDTNSFADAFVYDRTNIGTPVQILSVGPGGVPADFGSGFAGQGATSGQIAVSSNPNGTDCYVAFQSLASNLVPGANTGFLTIYMRDTATATTSLISATSTGAPIFGDSLGVGMSADARYVVFNTSAPGVVPGDTGYGGTFIRDRIAATTTKVSRSSQQISAAGGPFMSPFPYHPSISADGRFVAFESGAANLVPNDSNNRNSIFVRDLVENRTWRVDNGPAGAQANNECVAGWISGDGSTVAFASSSTNLVAPDTNGAVDIFVETFRPTTYGYCYGDGTGAACPCGNIGGPEKGCDNSFDTNGALLLGLGTTSVSSDTFVLAASTLTPSTSMIFLQGTAVVSQSFGDGLRCVGSTVTRLGRRVADAAGACSYGFGIAGDAPVSSAGSVPAAGATRLYQAWYRNSATFCTTSTFNLSNGLNVVWVP